MGRRHAEELVSPEGFRADGRLAEEPRAFSCEIGGLCATADGSAIVNMGRTKVLSYVFGPAEPSRGPSHPEHAEIRCHFMNAPFTTAQRSQRRTADKVSAAKAFSLRRIFESVILRCKYPRSLIQIFVNVIENDGGVFAAAVNATTLALIDAGIAVRVFVSGCTVGVVDVGKPLVDATRKECAAASAVLELAVYGTTQQVGYIHMDSRVATSKYLQMEASGVAACAQLVAAMENFVVDRYQRNLSTTIKNKPALAEDFHKST